MKKIRHPIIKQIVGRCHVSNCFESVLNTVIEALNGGRKSWEKLDNNTQEQIRENVEFEHLENRKLYDFVMK